MNGNADIDALDANISASNIVQALELVYSPHCSNETRKEATIYLEKAKGSKSAASLGHTLCSDHTRGPVVRNFGLLLLEHAIRYKWQSLTEEQADNLKICVVFLAENLTGDEPSFFRNKVAQIWVELAAVTWGREWVDMDEQLYKLWQRSSAHRDMVLHILETLSDEVFSKESSIVGAGGGALGDACTEIFIADEYLRQTSRFRYGSEGWFLRLLKFLEHALQFGNLGNAQIRASALMALATLRSTMTWIMLKAVSKSTFIDVLYEMLLVNDIDVQMACIEVLHTLYHRPNFQDEEILTLVCPLLATDRLQRMHHLYDSIKLDLEDINETKYTFLKKFTEALCAIAMFIDQRPKLIFENIDLQQMFNLLAATTAAHSLVVSIPVLYVWTKLLSSEEVGSRQEINTIMEGLLDICSQRLLRYETLPSDCADVTYLFLVEDFDTIPERHAFIGNYRRFCMDAIEQIVKKSPLLAVPYILRNAEAIVKDSISNKPAFLETVFQSNSISVLRVDAQATVVITAVKSSQKIFNAEQAGAEMHDEHPLKEALYSWCKGLLSLELWNPVIRKRLIQLVVDIATIALADTDVGVTICEYIISQIVTHTTKHTSYDEALRELYNSFPRELQKLAYVFHDQFANLYQPIEGSILHSLQNPHLDQRTKSEYRAFLFAVVLRATNIPEKERKERLQKTLQPVLDQWQSPNLDSAIADFESFCNLLGLNRFPRFFLGCGAENFADWSSIPLDSDGIELRETISERSETIPLQATRCLLTVSTDKTRPGSELFEVVKSQWDQAIPLILPRLLQLLRYSHAFSNPEYWAHVSPELPTVVKRILVDRVWQSGISSESRDDFYERVRNSKGSLEGLASAIRGAVRTVRELSYWILHCLSHLGGPLYGHLDLPEPLARALFENARHLSTHQCSALLKLASALIENCPTDSQIRYRFLKPLLQQLFQQFDVKITSEWSLIHERAQQNANEASLDREMKAESVLRQLTHSTVLLAQNLIGWHKSSVSAIVLNGEHTEEAIAATAERNLFLKQMIVSDTELLEPIILFCTHVLRVHDQRSCSIVTRTLKGLIPEFQRAPGSDGDATTPQIREFFSSTVFRACVESINDPYFTDLQKELASLLASIIALYSPITDTPRQILLSLPGVNTRQVDSALSQIQRSTSERQQRSWVLKLLEGIRGVSIAEMGKVDRSGSRKKMTTAQQQFSIAVEQPVRASRRVSEELAGVAEMFS